MLLLGCILTLVGATQAHLSSGQSTTVESKAEDSRNDLSKGGTSSYVGLLVHSSHGLKPMSKDLAGEYPKRVTLSLSLTEGRSVKLVKTENLFATTYRAERRGPNVTSIGTTVHASPPENCWYHAEDADQMAAVSLCNGVQGLWWVGDIGDKKDRILWIEPEVLRRPIKVEDIPSHTHKVYDVSSPEDLRCGTGDVGLFGHAGVGDIHAEAPIGEQSIIPRTVRVLYINDYARYRRVGSNIEMSTITLFNSVKEVYRKANLVPHVTVTLAGQMTFIEGNPFNPTTREGEEMVFGTNGLLDLWNDYRNDVRARLPVHDHGQLLSAMNFESRISGLAGVGTLCASGISGSITQLTYSELSNVVIMAHELGHGLGMRHDGKGNTCPSSGYIMQPSIGSSLDFSSCAIRDSSNFLQRTGQFCLPVGPNAITEPTSTLSNLKKWVPRQVLPSRHTIGGVVGTLLGLGLATWALRRVFKRPKKPTEAGGRESSSSQLSSIEPTLTKEQQGASPRSRKGVTEMEKQKLEKELHEQQQQQQQVREREVSPRARAAAAGEKGVYTTTTAEKPRVMLGEADEPVVRQTLHVDSAVPAKPVTRRGSKTGD